MSGGISRRALLVSGLCAAAAAGGMVLPTPGRGQVRRLDLAELVPPRLGAWKAAGDGRQVMPDENDRAAIARAYDQSFAQVFHRPDGRIAMLVIAHGDTNSGMLAIHRPATCYAAQGFTVLPRGSSPLPPPFATVTGEHLLAVRGQRVEPIISWMTIAGRQSGFGIAQNLAVMRAAWHDVPAEGLLIRGSTLGPDDPASYSLVADFLATLLRSVAPELRHQLGA